MNTVLVLEDDPSNMRGFSAVLSSIGYSVLEATTGKEGIEAGNRQECIDLFLSDVDVPGPSGTEVALELIKLHPTMPVLFVSGTPMYSWRRNDVDNFRQLPSDLVDFIEKPCRLSLFVEKVDELIEKRSRAVMFRVKARQVAQDASRKSRSSDVWRGWSSCRSSLSGSKPCGLSDGSRGSR